MIFIAIKLSWNHRKLGNKPLNVFYIYILTFELLMRHCIDYYIRNDININKFSKYFSSYLQKFSHFQEIFYVIIDIHWYKYIVILILDHWSSRCDLLTISLLYLPVLRFCSKRVTVSFASIFQIRAHSPKH